MTHDESHDEIALPDPDAVDDDDTGPSHWTAWCGHESVRESEEPSPAGELQATELGASIEKLRKSKSQAGAIDGAADVLMTTVAALLAGISEAAEQLYQLRMDLRRQTHVMAQLGIELNRVTATGVLLAHLHPTPGEQDATKLGAIADLKRGLIESLFPTVGIGASADGEGAEGEPDAAAE